AWGVRAAGNQGQVEPAIREKLLSLARDPRPEVRLQVAIAARKLRDIDALGLLLDVQRESSRDALIPYIIWQNLHPLLEERQVEVARWLEQFGWRETGFSRLLPRMIERLLAHPKADAKIVASVLSSCCRDDDPTREALGLVAARFRERSMPAAFQEAL